MIKVTEWSCDIAIGRTEYETVEDFLDDVLSYELAIEFLTELYGDVNIPVVGVKGAGEVIWSLTNSTDEWDYIYDDIKMNEVAYIEDTLATDGEMEYNKYTISDPDFSD